jgi:hypothetical protein
VVPARDRALCAFLLLVAVVAWAAVAALVTSVSPVGDATAQAAGAFLIGLACGLTVVPFAWLVVAALGGPPSPGGWLRAGRRGALVAVCVTVIVALRATGTFSPALGLFVAVLAALIELAFLLRR